jgi:hypothetical protein
MRGFFLMVQRSVGKRWNADDTDQADLRGFYIA